MAEDDIRYTSLISSIRSCLIHIYICPASLTAFVEGPRLYGSDHFIWACTEDFGLDSIRLKGIFFISSFCTFIFSSMRYSFRVRLKCYRLRLILSICVSTIPHFKNRSFEQPGVCIRRKHLIISSSSFDVRAVVGRIPSGDKGIKITIS